MNLSHKALIEKGRTKIIYNQFFVSFLSSSGTCIRVQTSNPQNYNIDKIQVIVNGLLHQTQTFNFNEFSISNLTESTTFEIKLIAESGVFKLHSNTINESTGLIDSLALRNKSTAIFNFNETSGNAIDSINNETAIIQGNIDQGIPGKLGSCYRFNSDGFLNFGQPNYLSGVNSYSFMNWFNVEQIGLTTFFRLGNDLIGSNWGLAIFYNPNGDQIMINIVNIDNSIKQYDNRVYNINMNSKLNSWQHIAGTYDSINRKTKLYLNGVLVGQTENTGSTLRNDNDSYMAKFDNTFDNSIWKADQLIIAKDLVFSDCDISDIYNNEQGIII